MRAVFRILHVVAAQLADWPLLWGLALVVPLFVVFFVLVRLCPLPQLIAWERRLLHFGAVGLLVAFTVTAAVYLWSAHFSDHVEPVIALNSWLLWNGERVYHLLDGEQRHTTPYGPYLYIFVGAMQAALGPSTFTSKLPAVVAALASAPLLYLAIVRRTSPSRAIMFTGLATGLWLPFRNTAVWSRPEPFLLFVVTVGLVAVTRRGYFSAALFGVAVAAAVGLKTHGLFYFIPLAVLAMRSGWTKRMWVNAVAAAAVVALAPFLLPHVSLDDYVQAVGVAAGYGFGRPDLQACLQWLVTIFAPAAIVPLAARLTPGGAPRALDRHSLLYVGAIVVSCLPVLVPASQTGAGPHHFIPFIPLLLFFAAEQSHQWPTFGWTPKWAGLLMQSVCYSWLISCVLVALWGTYALAEQALRRQPSGVALNDDIRGVIAAHRDKTLLMGVGDDETYWDTFMRHELVFAGNPPGLDPITMMDFKGRALPEPQIRAVIAELSSRADKPVMWLVPRGARPFVMNTWYAPHDSLFSDRFRADFAELFERSSSSEFFDLYTQKAAQGGAE